MRWFSQSTGTLGLRDIKRHRVLVLLIVAGLLMVAHALGAITVAEIGHGLLPTGQPISFAVGGLLVIAVLAKLAHLGAIGGVSAGVLRLREHVARSRRR